MKKRFIFLISLLVIGFNTVTAQDSTIFLSLKMSCQLGFEKNLNVQNADLEQQKNHFKLAEVRSKLYPQIEAYSSFNYYYAIPKMVLPGEIFGQTGMIPVEIGTKYDWSSGFKATQVLYSQSYFTSLKLSEQLLTMGSLNLKQKKEEIIYQITQVYHLCRATAKQIEQLEIALKNSDNMIAIAKVQNENGVIRKIDYSRISVNKSNLMTQIDNLNRLLQQQEGFLKYLTGVDVTSSIELTDSLASEPIEIPSVTPDFNNRTELELLDSQLELATLSRKMNQQQYLPMLSGFGQYYYQGQRNEFDFFKGGNDKFFKTGFVGLSLTIPIFDGLEKRFKSLQYGIEMQQLQNTKKNTINYFSKEFADAANQYKLSINALQRQQDNIKLAEETYNISLQGYRQQVVSLSDLLMSESSLIEARLSYINALLELKNAELEVKKAKGELLNF